MRVSEQITALAPDAVECTKLARTLALRLTDDVTDGIIAMSYYKTNELPSRGVAGVGWRAGKDGV